MTSSRRFVAALCALTLLGAAVTASPVARAQISAADKETARALMKDGEAKKSKGDFKGALEAYRAAHAIMNVPTTGLETGRMQERLGMLVEARDTLLSVTRLPVVPGESANMGLARDEAQKLADAIEPRIVSLKIVLENVPSGAAPKVSIDGTPIHAETIGVARRLNPGSHEVVVTVGADEKAEKVEIAEGESKELAIDLAGIGKAKPKDPPEGSTEAKPDPHDTPPPIEEPPPPPPPQKSPLVWYGFGAAAGLGLVGAVTGVFAYTTASSAKDRCEGNLCPPAVHADVKSARTYGTISNVTFGLAAVGAVVGVIGLFRSSKAAPEQPASGAVGLSVGWGSVALHGTF